MQQDDFETHYQLGQRYLKQKKNQQAQASFLEALKYRPQDPQTLFKLAQILSPSKPQQALGYLEMFLKTQAASPQIYYLQAQTYQHLQKPEIAKNCLEKALHLQAHHFPSLYLLAKLEAETGAFEKAFKLLEIGAKAEPQQTQFWLAWSKLLFAQGQHAKTLQILTEGLEQVIAPIPLLFQLGSFLGKFRKIELALRQFEKILALEPNHLRALRQLAMLYEQQGDIQNAKLYYNKLLQLKPKNHLLRLHLELLSPSILNTPADTDRWEETQLNILNHWFERKAMFNLEETAFFSGYPNFISIYHTRGNGRQLREKMVQLFLPQIPSKPPLKISKPKPRIGFVVTDGHAGVFIKSMAGILNHLSVGKYQLLIFCTPQEYQKTISPRLTHPDIQHIPLPSPLEAAAERIYQSACDILNFWEISTDNQNLFLPAYQLAPIQTLSWGTPMTSGNPKVNYYLSSIHLESAQAQANYSETLHLFSVLPSYYYHPKLPVTFKSRADLGFSEAENLYLVSQNIYKIHPDFDQTLRLILRQDPLGRILFLESKLPYLNLELQKRLQISCSEEAERIRFLPKRPFADYLNLVYLADLVLDPPHYVGANTSYDAFAVGTPVITKPTPFQRGRHTYAAYQEMGIQDAIAWSEAEYIEKARYYATHKEARQTLSQRILSQKSCLFENIQIVHEYEQFFDNVLSSR